MKNKVNDFGFELLYEGDGYYKDFKSEKLTEKDFNEIEKELLKICQNKDPRYLLKKLQSSRKLIYYFKYKKSLQNKQYRVFVYIRLENFTLNVIGIKKRNQNSSYKKQVVKLLEKRVN